LVYWLIGWVILKKRKSTGILGNGGNGEGILKKKGNDWWVIAFWEWFINILKEFRKKIYLCLTKFILY
jgi:hypothetical protein